MPAPRVLRLVLAFVLILAGAVIWCTRTDRARETTPSSDAGATTARDASADRGPDARSPSARAPEDPLPDANPPGGLSALDDRLRGLFPEDDPAWAWSRVDLEALRAEMPDNTFWRLAAPTDDPALLAEREAIRERWNEAYGKVLSNTGTEQEVRDFYAERREISEDYVAFTTALLDRYGDALPERDRGLVELARTLHRTRLEEMPRRLAEALDRREAHARARAEWLAEEAAFAADPSDGAPISGSDTASPTERVAPN